MNIWHEAPLSQRPRTHDIDAGFQSDDIDSRIRNRVRYKSVEQTFTRELKFMRFR